MISIGNNIKSIHFADEIGAVFCGSNLVWEKVQSGTPIIPTTHTLAGTLVGGNTATTITVTYESPYTTETITLEVSDSTTGAFEYTFDRDVRLITFNNKDVIKTITKFPKSVRISESLFNMVQLVSCDLSSSVLHEGANSLHNLFLGCTALQTVNLSGWDFRNIRNMGGMFYECSALTELYLNGVVNTSNVTDVSEMFYKCTNLTTLNLNGWDMSNVTNANSMFKKCTNLMTLDLSGWNMSNLTNANSMFYDCTNLTTLNLNGWNMSNVTDAKYMFDYCSYLTTVTGSISGIKANIDLSTSSHLTNESAMVFINGLANVTSTKTIKLWRTTYDTLTPEQIAIATSKGWTVVRG